MPDVVLTQAQRQALTFTLKEQGYPVTDYADIIKTPHGAQRLGTSTHRHERILELYQRIDFSRTMWPGVRAALSRIRIKLGIAPCPTT